MGRDLAELDRFIARGQRVTWDDPFAAAEAEAPPRRKGRRTETRSRGAVAADEFEFQCRAFKLPPVVREHRFARGHTDVLPVAYRREADRQWRFDFAFMDQKLAVEIEGLVVRRIAGQVVVTGRHATVTGFREDLRKYASATILGWTVLRFEQAMVRTGEAIDVTQRVLAERGWAR